MPSRREGRAARPRAERGERYLAVPVAAGALRQVEVFLAGDVFCRRDVFLMP